MAEKLTDNRVLEHNQKKKSQQFLSLGLGPQASMCVCPPVWLHWTSRYCRHFSAPQGSCLSSSCHVGWVNRSILLCGYASDSPCSLQCWPPKLYRKQNQLKRVLTFFFLPNWSLSCSVSPKKWRAILKLSSHSSSCPKKKTKQSHAKMLPTWLKLYLSTSTHGVQKCFSKATCPCINSNIVSH